MKRRSAIAALACLVELAPAAESALPIPDSMQRVASLAGRRGEPLVLLISLPGCPYCELVRRNYLLPMRAEGLAAWELMTNNRVHPVRDFHGQQSTGASLAALWKIRVTPTVLFFDMAGIEIAARIEGISLPDFYGAYLDEALVAARKRIKGQT